MLPKQGKYLISSDLGQYSEVGPKKISFLLPCTFCMNENPLLQNILVWLCKAFKTHLQKQNMSAWFSYL